MGFILFHTTFLLLIARNKILLISHYILWRRAVGRQFFLAYNDHHLSALGTNELFPLLNGLKHLIELVMTNMKLDLPSYPEAAEAEWNEALQNLDQRMVIYSKAKAGGNEREMDRAAEDVALAMEDVADKHPDPQVKKEYLMKAEKLRNSTGDNREGILEDIGKGLLILFTTPFALVGTVLQGVGQILGGVGSILRGLGKLAGKPRDLVG